MLLPAAVKTKQNKKTFEIVIPLVEDIFHFTHSLYGVDVVKSTQDEGKDMMGDNLRTVQPDRKSVV